MISAIDHWVCVSIIYFTTQMTEKYWTASIKKCPQENPNSHCWSAQNDLNQKSKSTWSAVLVYKNYPKAKLMQEELHAKTTSSSSSSSRHSCCTSSGRWRGCCVSSSPPSSLRWSGSWGPPAPQWESHLKLKGKTVGGDRFSAQK